MRVLKLFAVLALLAFTLQAPGAGAAETVRLGTSTCGVFPALPVIAEEKGYLDEAGIELELVEYGDFGKSLRDLDEGALDMAMSTDLPTAIHLVDGGDYTVFANLALTGSSQGVLARKDRGVEKPRDLKGKKIGVLKGSGPHYFLHIYLLHHGLQDQVGIVFLSFPEIIPAFVKGEVDAYCMWPDMILKGRERYEGETVYLTEDNLVIKTAHLGAEKGYIEKNPKLAEAFLRAMLKAERFMKRNRGRALEIVAAHRGRPVEKVEMEWKEWDFGISLYQSLLLGFESVAKWAIEQGFTRSGEMPDFMDHIHAGTLERIEPESVTIID